jgi:monoamine oxidase
MATSAFEVVIVGGGAAGVAAARRLHDAGVNCLLVEGRGRLGGRAWAASHAGFPLDLGCGWLHSADRNPWVAIAERQGRTIDRTPPPWSRPSLPFGFPVAAQHEFSAAMNAFFARVSAAAARPDRAAAELLEPGCRWNGMIRAVYTYISGAELEHISVHDVEHYDDTHVNWSVVEGYGAVVAAHAASVPLALNCPVTAIDHSGAGIKIDTAQGTLTAAQVIVTLPTTVLAEEAVSFSPALPDKVEAARGLPLGLADKLFLSLDGAEEFEPGSRLFGRTDRAATASYHLRPFGRPMIEAYFGGDNARALEQGGERAFFDFAVGELTGLLGSSFARRLAPIASHGWGADPFARGSYSSALPGHAGARAILAAPVDGRLFFAGEACSLHDFSTAHGALLTGLNAAELVLNARGMRTRS